VLWQAPPTPAPPPPLAFRTATLRRADHAIDVELMAVARVDVRVTITRAGHRLGRGIDHLDRGSTFVRVPIGPKSLRPLRRGLHVNVDVEYGPPTPVHAFATLILPAPGDHTGDDAGGPAL
jgi:hypothetical protein